MPSTVSLRTRNITRVYRSATPEQLAYGLEWYRRANALAHELDPTNPTRAAGVIAVLSPMLSWDINVRLARQAYAWHRLDVDPGTIAAALPCLRSNARKAGRILSGEDPRSVVSGPKVTRFFLAIVNPAEPSSVVVDRHAFDVAAGRVTDDATRGAVLGRNAGYLSVQELYQRAAVALTRSEGRPVTPTEVQAVTWTVWRETAIRTAGANRRERAA